MALLMVAGCARPGTVPEPGTGRSSPPLPVTSAAMGLRATGLHLRNCGRKPLTVEGYPALELLDEDRKRLDVRVVQGVREVARIDHWEVEPRRETVEPGESLVSVLVWRNLTTDGATIVTGEFLSVAPSGGLPGHTLALHVDAGNTGKVAVAPWIAQRRR
ncbi:DUF4232 domain-containing protein [Actinoplanes sp. NPDC023801]|uniref:DUF4232 domain-containing protein n=1 Tax=Actinoplanes sp. NPDC023801 TaxID=3154595 RepID=UPI0033DB533D